MAGQMDQLQAAFRAAVGARATALEAASEELRGGNAEAADSIRRMAHALRGVGGTYGFPEVSDAAAACEEAPADGLLTALGRLQEVLRQVREDLPARRAGGADQPPPAPMIRVLLVDDDPLVLLAAGAALGADGGFEVRGADSAATALRQAAAEPPDVVVTDVQLPDRDGPELIARLRMSERTRGVPVIFLTASAEGPEGERLRALGARGVIAKPFDPFGLAAEIRRLLED
jgi:CheY-like chemotaxis protein